MIGNISNCLNIRFTVYFTIVYLLCTCFLWVNIPQIQSHCTILLYLLKLNLKIFHMIVSPHGIFSMYLQVEIWYCFTTFQVWIQVFKNDTTNHDKTTILRDIFNWLSYYNYLLWCNILFVDFGNRLKLYKKINIIIHTDIEKGFNGLRW